MQTLLEPVRLLTSSATAYAARLARDASEVRAAQALRFAVFNLELNEGLAESLATGLDADPFDEVCDHLLVEHVPTGEIVGTYRLQTGLTAAENRGYYSEQEFDFRPFEPIRAELIELGRACVHQQHRNLVVLGLLWKGIADYSRERGGRYLCGCSSITSQDPAVGASAYAELCRKHLASSGVAHQTVASLRLPARPSGRRSRQRSRSFSAPTSPSAPKICGPPALDRQFKTIDFLTLLDLQSLPALVRARFLS